MKNNKNPNTDNDIQDNIYNQLYGVISRMYSSSCELYNIFVMYYHRRYKIEKDFLFKELNDIDYKRQATYDSNFMYEFIEEIQEYKKYKDDYDMVGVFDSNDIDVDGDVYELLIDFNQHKVCKTLIPLLQYILTLDNWETINWKIEKLIEI